MLKYMRMSVNRGRIGVKSQVRALRRESQARTRESQARAEMEEEASERVVREALVH